MVEGLPLSKTLGTLFDNRAFALTVAWSLFLKTKKRKKKVMTVLEMHAYFGCTCNV
jgi:hypothetical protein